MIYGHKIKMLVGKIVSVGGRVYWECFVISAQFC